MTKKKVVENIHIVPEEKRMLVSGMTVKQAINDARRWWNKDGRDYFRRQRDREEDGIKGDEELMHSSGILAGKLFDECDNETKNEIVKAWHHTFCQIEFGIDMEEYLRRAQQEMFGVVVDTGALNAEGLDTQGGF